MTAQTRAPGKRPNPMLSFALACAALPALAATPSWNVEGRDGPTGTLYTGRVGARAVTLYLKSEPLPCGADRRLLSAIYRYDGASKWLQLQASADRKGHLALVESGLGTGISGAMMLSEKDGRLRGRWISPDGERLLPVELRKAALPEKKREQMEDALEKTQYDNNDC
ncbi:hypothetical protein [Lysobacter sp. CA199]|uniref:hypothetical protein n=1 Tax=Lysobacter sp. CA199 TaxID=3455608 RepID=UPI003F8D87D8